MAETITRTTRPATSNPIMDPVLYWRVSAFALSAVALLGILVNVLFGNEKGLEGFLMFDWGHNIVHVVLALAAFIFGFGNLSAGITKTFAIIFGFVYAGLGVLGFIVADLGILHLEIGENLIHLVLGAWALTAGFGADY